MNIVAAVPIDESLAQFMGKKGSTNSITFYNRRLGGGALVALQPSQDDDKIYALAETLLLSDVVVLSTVTIDRKFGEALVAASLLEKPLLLTDDNDASGLLRDAGVQSQRVVSRAELLSAVRSVTKTQKDGAARVDIDKAFPVKGIGTVALGIVTRGTLRQHDKLYHTSGKQVTVRSIQSQDVDIVEAPAGTRVGLSLKDIDESEVSKGDLLTQNAVGRTGRITIEYHVSQAAKETMKDGAQLGVAADFSYSECTVKSVAASSMELELKAPIPVEIGDEVLLLRRSVPRIFASGRVKTAL